MKSITNIFLISTITILLCSCKDDGVSFGDVKYHPSFLWVDAEMTPVKKVFEFDFSQDAKDDKSTFAEFQFVDNNGKPIATSEMQVFMDGHQLQDNKFVVKSNVTSKELEFTFSPEIKEGKHQGFLKLTNHQLDRLDSQPLYNGQKVDAFQWTLNYDKRMNPLAKVLMWIGIAILAMLVIWFIIFRPIFYPRFGSIQKTFIAPGMAPLIVRFKGARMVVVAASHPKKQSGWNRFWTGKILYKTYPAFDAPVVFKPSRGRRVLAKVQAGTYQVMPNPMPGIGSATIIDIKKNLKINVN